ADCDGAMQELSLNVTTATHTTSVGCGPFDDPKRESLLTRTRIPSAIGLPDHGQRERGAKPGRREGLEPDVAMVEVRNLPDEVQSQSRALLPRVGPLQREELLEHSLLRVLRHPGPLVLDQEAHARPGEVSPQSDPSAGGAEVDCVLHEVRDRLVQ